VVEGTRLESEQTRKRLEGSNPSLSGCSRFAGRPSGASTPPVTSCDRRPHPAGAASCDRRVLRLCFLRVVSRGEHPLAADHLPVIDRHFVVTVHADVFGTDV